MHGLSKVVLSVRTARVSHTCQRKKLHGQGGNVGPVYADSRALGRKAVGQQPSVRRFPHIADVCSRSSVHRLRRSRCAVHGCLTGAASDSSNAGNLALDVREASIDKVPRFGPKDAGVGHFPPSMTVVQVPPPPESSAASSMAKRPRNLSGQHPACWCLGRSGRHTRWDARLRVFCFSVRPKVH